jgi:hypothetical protein
MIRVIAVDPGERVGWCTATIHTTAELGFKIEQPSDPTHLLSVQDHGIAFLKDAALQIHQAVAVEKRFDVVIYETFLLTARGAKVMVGSDLQTAQFVGMVRQSAWLNPDCQLVPQGPAAMSSARKSLRCGHPSAEDVAERISKLPKSHDDSHDGSALLHLWNFFFARYV